MDKGPNDTIKKYPARKNKDFTIKVLNPAVRRSRKSSSQSHGIAYKWFVLHLMGDLLSGSIFKETKGESPLTAAELPDLGIMARRPSCPRFAILR